MYTFSEEIVSFVNFETINVTAVKKEYELNKWLLIEKMATSIVMFFMIVPLRITIISWGLCRRTWICKSRAWTNENFKWW